MKIAIAGGIGSGKSEVLKIIKDYGMHVESADSINKELFNNESYLAELTKTFPQCTDVNGNFSLYKLKELIFMDEISRKKLNSLAHPLILEYIKKTDDKDIIFFEIPLLIESSSSNLFDKIWAVKSSRHSRVKRIILRDSVNRKKAIIYLKAQQKEEKIFNIADEIIVNESDLLSLKEQVESLLKKIYIKK